MGIVNIKEFNWKPDVLAGMDILGEVEYLVVHHTVSPDVSAQTIDEWHKNMGYLGIGYHYVIRRDGSIEKGRPDNKMGAHAYGFNKRSLGIVLTGDFTSAVPSPAQMNALEELLKALRAKYPFAKVVKHSDLNATSCPGAMFPWGDLMQRLEGGVAALPEQWKLDLVRRAKQAGLITEDHNPDDPASKWFVLAVALNLLKAVKG